MKVKNVVVYSFSWPAEPNGLDALGHLRLAAPLRHLGLNIIYGVEKGQIFPERVSQGEIVIVQRHIPGYFDQYKQIVDIARREGKPIVYELDDMLFALQENHPSRLEMAFTPFLLPMLQAVMQADLVTVSTPALKKALEEYNPNIEIFPNYFDDSLWRLREPARKKMPDEPIIIGYMGTNSHQPDLDYISPVIKDLIKRYPQKIRFHVWGIKPSLEMLALPQVKWIPPHSFCYPDFAEFFQTQAADIFLAPLVDNFFNRFKSPLKFFEYSALGVPGVYSRLDLYEDAITHEQDGLLASSLDEWRECLVRLIENDNLRFELATRAQATIKNNWLLSNNAFRWNEILQSAFDGKKTNREQGANSVDVVESINSQLFEAFQALAARASERDQAISTLTAQLSQTRAELEHTRAELEHTRAELEHTRAELEHIRAEVLTYVLSKSWQVTRPLRKINKMFKKFRGGMNA